MGSEPNCTFPGWEVKVYDAAGRFLHRFGRPGQGPGEFDRIRHVFPMGDSVVGLLDDPSGLKFFDPSGQLLREARLPFLPTSNGAVYADRLGLVVVAHVPTPERAGLPLHLIDLDDGSVKMSFGSPTGEYRIRDGSSRGRVLAKGLPVQYGQHGWYERPNTYLVGLAATDSLLWVELALADENWREGSRDPDRAFDTIFEVIDLDALQVVGHIRLDESYSNFGGPGRIGRTVVTPEGSVRYQVFRIVVGEPDGQQIVPGEVDLPVVGA